MNSVDAIVRKAVRTWRRLGVPAGDAEAMSRELAGDLAAARADGRDPLTYVGGDPAGFARAWAASRGVVRPRRRLLSVAGAGLLGTLPGVGLALLFLTLPSSVVFNDFIGNRSFLSTTTEGGVGGISFSYAVPVELIGLIAFCGYLIGGVVAVLGCLTLTSLLLKALGDPARARTVRLLARLIPIIGTAAVLAGAGAASLNDFTYGSATVVLTLSASAVVAVAGFAITRLVAFSGASGDSEHAAA